MGTWTQNETASHCASRATGNVLTSSVMRPVRAFARKSTASVNCVTPPFWRASFKFLSEMLHLPNSKRAGDALASQDQLRNLCSQPAEFVL